MAALVRDGLGVWREWAPGLLALGVGWGGTQVLRGQEGVAGALGVALGWGVLVPESVMRAGSPGIAGACAGAALAVGVAAWAQGRVRSRWWTVLAVLFGAWWLARTPGGRVEFWRVEFALVVAAGVLTAERAGRAAAGLGVALTLLGGVWAAGAAGVWGAAMGVLAAGCLGVWLGTGVMAPGVLAVGVVGAELGAGRLLRSGGPGVGDFAAAGALVAPLLVPGVERWLGRRVGRAGPVGAGVVVAAVLVGVAWVLARAWRG